MKTRSLSTAASLALALYAPVGVATAQQPGPGTAPLAGLRAWDATAGSPAERTLLLLSLLSSARFDATLRSLAPGRAEAIMAEYGRDTSAGVSRPWLRFGTPLARVSQNTGMARADMDGAVWQGRGATVSLSGGVVLRAPFVSLSLRPVAFRSQNRAYVPFVPPASAADFGNPSVVYPIDMPYRFGDRAYGRLDPGESWLRIGTRHMATGFTSASQHWGPAHYYPMILGTEAGGFPRVFVEGRDVPGWIGSGSLHWMVGRLESSPIFQAPPGERSRIAAAVIASFSPYAFPGVTIGGSRFFHGRWDAALDLAASAQAPVNGLFKKNFAASDQMNQLASVFARVAPPGAGVEVYGEFSREDANMNLRDLSVEPDHSGNYTLGMRRAWRRDGRIEALTLEMTNARYSHLARIREQGPPYVHSTSREGHTQLGQLLGNSAALGGDGRRVAWERIEDHVTWSVDAEVRTVAQNMEGGRWSGRKAGLFSVRAGTVRQVGKRAFGSALVLQKGTGRNQAASNIGLDLSVRAAR